MTPTEPTTTQVIPVSNPSVRTVVTSTIPTDHPSFDKFVAILQALEPVILLGVSPFISNPQSQQIALSEHTVAQNLFQALSKL